jgi:hypothetical protein
MYTGIRVTDLIPKRDETESSQPGPDQPVGAIKLYNLTDDNLKVTYQLINIRCHWDRR